jgi:hypothetical protein
LKGVGNVIKEVTGKAHALGKEDGREEERKDARAQGHAGETKLPSPDQRDCGLTMSDMEVDDRTPLNHTGTWPPFISGVKGGSILVLRDLARRVVKDHLLRIGDIDAESLQTPHSTYASRNAVDERVEGAAMLLAEKLLDAVFQTNLQVPRLLDESSENGELIEGLVDLMEGLEMEE